MLVVDKRLPVAQDARDFSIYHAYEGHTTTEKKQNVQ
jgi:hypothetical protein